MIVMQLHGLMRPSEIMTAYICESKTYLNQENLNIIIETPLSDAINHRVGDMVEAKPFFADVPAAFAAPVPLAPLSPVGEAVVDVKVAGEVYLTELSMHPLLKIGKAYVEALLMLEGIYWNWRPFRYDHASMSYSVFHAQKYQPMDGWFSA